MLMIDFVAAANRSFPVTFADGEVVYPQFA